MVVSITEISAINVTERRKNPSQQGGLGQDIQKKRSARSAGSNSGTLTNR
jgi:hypothetical protein